MNKVEIRDSQIGRPLDYLRTNRFFSDPKPELMIEPDSDFKSHKTTSTSLASSPEIGDMAKLRDL